jgi:hypothetical protein
MTLPLFILVQAPSISLVGPTSSFGLQYDFWGFCNGVDGSSCTSWYFFSFIKVSLSLLDVNFSDMHPVDVYFSHINLSLCQSLSIHMIKDRDYNWAILLSQVTWPTEENVCMMLIHGEHQHPGPFSLAKSCGHLRRISARCIYTILLKYFTCSNDLHPNLGKSHNKVNAQPRVFIPILMLYESNHVNR